jgi:hypothetical protein
MLKFNDYLLESNGEQTKSFWKQTKEFIKEGMEKGARVMEEKMQEMGYEFSKHVSLLDINGSGYGFGIGVHFTAEGKKYFVVDNFIEGFFKLYEDDDRKGYYQNKEEKFTTGPKLLSKSIYLEDVLKDVKHINVGKKFLEVHFELENLETEETTERELKVDITDILESNLKSYVQAIHNTLLAKINDPEEFYHTVFFFKDKSYRLMGGKRGFDLMDENDKSIKL